MLFRRRFSFLPPELATPEGIVGIGGPLDVETLRTAYRRGIFPWPHEGYPLLWFHPNPRAVLDFDALHVPERLGRKWRKKAFTFTVDCAFDAVIDACKASPRPGQDGTWITPKMLQAYKDLHQAGDAHSVEAWDCDGNLVGGLYGVTAGGFFSGESMFHTISDVSKLCVLFLVDYLKDNGCTWIDIQTMTPHFELLGATEIPRSEFLRRIERVQSESSILFPKSE